MSANSRQVAGTHYQSLGRVQHWDVVSGCNIGYLEGCASKYLLRWRDKNGIEDLQKAEHFTQKLFEMVSCGSIVKNLSKVTDSILNEFYECTPLPALEKELIDGLFRWRTVDDIVRVQNGIRDLIEQEECGPGPGYVNQD